MSLKRIFGALQWITRASKFWFRSISRGVRGTSGVFRESQGVS